MFFKQQKCSVLSIVLKFMITVDPKSREWQNKASICLKCVIVLSKKPKFVNFIDWPKWDVSAHRVFGSTNQNVDVGDVFYLLAVLDILSWEIITDTNLTHHSWMLQFASNFYLPVCLNLSVCFFLLARKSLVSIET